MKLINRGRHDYNDEPRGHEIEVSDAEGARRLRDFAGSDRFCFERTDFLLALDAPVPQDEKVTVMIPVFNGAKFLEQSVASLLAQTYKNLEVLICDDGSTDGTREILKALADKDQRVKVFRNKENKSVGFSRRRLLAACKTRLAAWQDADDIALPKRIERQVQGILELEAKFPDRKFLVYCDWQWLRVDGTPEDKGHHKQFNCLLFSRNEGTPTVDPDLNWGEDLKWHGDMIDAGYCEAIVPEVLQGYRKHDASLTQQRIKKEGA